MITLYEKSTTDFTHTGIAYLHPLTCTVTETLNAEWELELTHPYDDWGKWRKLLPENIIVAKVPVCTPPQTKLLLETDTHKLYQIHHKDTSVKVHAYPLEDAPCIAQCPYQATVLGGTVESSMLEVLTTEGVHGYVPLTQVAHVDTVSQNDSPFKETARFREQPFRIYRVVKSLNDVKVYAKHIFYDLMNNLILPYEPSESVLGKDVLQYILSHCLLSHSFTTVSTVVTTAKRVVFEHINPVEAIIGSEGVCEKYKCDVCRDWYDIHSYTPKATSAKTPFTYRKNVTVLTCDVDASEVITAILPTGQDGEGNPVYLSPKIQFSPNVSVVSGGVKLAHVEVDDASVTDEVSLSVVKERLQAKVTEMFAEGCHLPTITLDVNFVNLADMVGYAEPFDSAHIQMGDLIRVVVEDIDLDETMRLTQYQYNCLSERFTTVSIGAVRYSKEGTIIMRE